MPIKTMAVQIWAFGAPELKARMQYQILEAIARAHGCQVDRLPAVVLDRAY